MLRSLKNLQDYTLQTQDGATADITDFIIDDFNWLVRYIVAQIGNQTVIISTAVFNAFDDETHHLSTYLTQAAMLDAPQIDWQTTLTRSDEEMLSQHYGWSPYWEEVLPEDVPNTFPGDLTAIPMLDLEADLEHERERLAPVSDEPDKESHLRSGKQLLGCKIIARGEDAGHLSDILTQESDWDLHYLVVDTGGFLSGEKVLLSPQWVQEIDHASTHMLVDLDRETLHKSPELDSLEFK